MCSFAPQGKRSPNQPVVVCKLEFSKCQVSLLLLKWRFFFLSTTGAFFPGSFLGVKLLSYLLWHCDHINPFITNFLIVLCGIEVKVVLNIPPISILTLLNLVTLLTLKLGQNWPSKIASKYTHSCHFEVI